MKKSLKILLITMLCLIVVFSLTGCSASGKEANANPNPNPQTDNNNTPPPKGDEPVKNSGSTGQEELKQWDGVKGKIITDNYPVEVTKYLEDNKAKETQQAFNINNRTYLVLTMGQQPSAGYTIQLKDLILKDGALKVLVKYEKPRKDEMVATVLTYPSLVVETDDIYEGHYEIVYDIQK